MFCDTRDRRDVFQIDALDGDRGQSGVAEERV